MSQLSNHINLWTTATGAVSCDAVCARKGGVVKARSDVQIAGKQLQVKSVPCPTDRLGMIAPRTLGTSPIIG